MFFDSFVFNVIPKLEKYWDRHLLMLFFGAISGGIAISVVYPFDVARTLLASGENYVKYFINIETEIIIKCIRDFKLLVY